MVTLTLLPSGEKLRFPRGTRLDEALTETGHGPATPCGGRGLCGKCRVEVKGQLSPPSPEEKKLLDEPGCRLSCLTFLEGDAEVNLSASIHPVTWRGPAFSVEPPVSVAIDIGTTTLVAAAANPRTGEILHTVSSLNPQRRFGHDVISRIAAASDPDKRDKLVRLLRSGITSLVRTLLDELDLRENDIASISAAGNTVMSYFLLDMDTAPLGTAPYTAASRDFTPLEIPGLPGLPPLRIMPVISAYGGGDLLGGMTLIEDELPEGATFFADLGTNGEMYLRTAAGRIYATSCAMGPALEGMNISRGMTASPGAVTHVTSSAGKLIPHVLGGGEPAGISGTGLIDLTAHLLRAGAVLPSGSFGSPAPGITIDPETGKISLTGQIFLTRRDIRNLQLAKGACLAAARVLINESGISTDQVSTVVISGAFGENLDLECFRALGFLPDFPGAGYLFRGNTSLQSALKLNADPSFLLRAMDLRDKTVMIDLASRTDFQDVFLSSLDFPSAKQ